MGSEEAVGLILYNLKVNYTEIIPATAELFVDRFGYHDTDIERLCLQINDNDLRYLYRSLLVNWILKSDHINSFRLGFTEDGDTLPIFVHKPFSNKQFKCIYTWWGLVASPCNMILAHPNEEYIKVASELFKYMHDTYDSVMAGLVKLRSHDAIEVYADSYRELKVLLSM